MFVQCVVIRYHKIGNNCGFVPMSAHYAIQMGLFIIFSLATQSMTLFFLCEEISNRKYLHNLVEQIFILTGHKCID